MAARPSDAANPVGAGGFKGGERPSRDRGQFRGDRGERGNCGKNGEPGRNRTCDNLIKSQMLYQLSYGPRAR